MISSLKAALKAGYVLAALGCPAVPPVEHVEMVFTNKPPLVSNDQTAQQLGQYKISTTFSRSRNEIFTIGGLHISEIAPRYMLEFTLMELPKQQAVCLAPSAVSIVVEYAPRILMAKEYAPGSCKYKVILAHEMRHVGTDIVTLNEFLPQFEKAVTEAVRNMKPMGPMAPGSIDLAKDKMVDTVRAALTAAVEEFDHVRFNRQQLLDTRQEYLRGSHACD
jgi:hypothetical protein